MRTFSQAKQNKLAMAVIIATILFGINAFALLSGGRAAQIQLVGGSTEHSGRVEVYYNGNWTAICGLFWDLYDAMVVCRELDIYTTGIVVYPVAFYGSGVGNQVLLPHCNGGEAGLFECNIEMSQYCSHDYDAAVDCVPYGQGLMDIRLVGGSADYMGRVEVLFDVNESTWGTVCNVTWSIDDAKVACRSLGYIDGVLDFGVYAGGNGTIITINCLGHEERLQQCSFSTSPSICTHSNDIGIHCHPYECTTYTCHENAMCDSLNYCHCQSGYYGNGLICQNIDECAESSPCDRNAVCIDIDGSYECLCNEGYFGNGSVCADIDECLEERSCHENADCINTPGFFICLCQNMFHGDGMNCTRGPSHLDVRLVDGGSYYGRVEVYDANTGVWGTICGDEWDLRDGQVVGRQLGLNSTSIDVFSDVSLHGFGEGPNKVFLLLNCTGVERRLNDCFYTTYPSSCSHPQDAGIIFWPDNNLYDIRLRGHNFSWSGRVEVLYDVIHNLWGTICGLGTDHSIAQVVCRQLGFFNGEVDIASISSVVNGSIFKKNCTGSENSISECAGDVNTSDCDHSSDIVVFCYPNLYRTNQVRLTGPDPWERSVEILYDIKTMSWGTVCNDSDWDLNEADVVCKQLGYYLGANHTIVLEGDSGSSYSVFCSGNEIGLANCSIDNQVCAHDGKAGVSCNAYCCSEDSHCHEKATCNSVSVCVCGIGYRGSGRWCNNINECQEGTFTCDSNANCIDTDGSYMCECHENYTGDGETCSLVDKCAIGQILCPENADCIEDSSGNFSCVCHSGFSGDDCSCADGEIFLSNGSAGRLEVCFNNTYGTVCDDYWDDLDAKVVCRQHGFNATTSVAVKNARFGEGNGPIWFDDMHCTGDELNLLNCSSGVSLNSSNCEHREDAGVICQSQCEVDSVRLAVDNTRDLYIQPSQYPPYYFVKGELHRGVVTLCDSSGQYRPFIVCDNSWTDIAAAIVCGELGFSTYGAVGLQTHSFPLIEGNISSAFAVVSLQCFGNELTIRNCVWTPRNLDVDETCNYDEVAEVICQDYSIPGANCTNGDIRLADYIDDPVANTRSGQLQVCVNGAWGAICSDNYFGYVEMAVACRHMNFSDKDIVLLEPLIAMETLPIFLDSLFCSGYESTLLDCPPFPHGLHQCIGRETVHLQCRDIDECDTAHGMCQHYCNNTVGSYSCSCFPGYTLDSDGVTCLDSDYCNTTGEVRLVNGSTALDGVVEVCFEGEYRLICDSFWDELEARVVCSQLGYNLGGVAIPPHGPFERTFLLNKTLCDGSENNILECSTSYQELGIVVECPSSLAAAVSCGVTCVEGDVRLNPLTLDRITDFFADPESYTKDYYFVNDQLATGRVEVCLEGEYVTLCGDNWDNHDASVVCSQLGFSAYGALALDSSVFGSDGSQSRHEISCSGNETQLLDCSSLITQCSEFHQASVLCQNRDSTYFHECVDGSVRLVNDTADNANDGRGSVELCLNHAWGRVCGDQFGSEEAMVACLSVGGFSREGAEVYESVDVGVGPVFVKDLACDGTETSLLQCAEKVAPIRAVSCEESSNIEIVCEDIDECSTGQNLCSQLCNNTVGSYYCSCFDGFSLDLDHYSCNDIDECVSKPCDDNATCTNMNGSFDCACDVGYTGNGTFCEDIDECEVSSNTCSHGCNNTRGSYECFCDLGFVLESDQQNCTDINECSMMLDNCNSNAECINDVGNYTCKCMPGYTGDGFNCSDIDECYDQTHTCDYNANCSNSAPLYTCTCRDGYTGNGTHCEDIDECMTWEHDCDTNAVCHNNEGSFSCSCITGYQGNGSYCYCVDGHVLLVNGSVPSEGRAEVCLNNSYGAVCDDYWDVLDATVVCRQLGFDNGTATTFMVASSHSEGQFVLDDVHCNGSEDSLLDCRSTLFFHDCIAGEEAGVRCYNEFCVDGTIRLFLGDDDVAFYHGAFDPSLYHDKDKLSRGRVEYCINQTYYSICGDAWEYAHASVVCRHLGFSPYGAIPVTQGHFGSPVVPLLPYEFYCNGSEESLSECRNMTSDSDDDICVRDDAGVVCQSPFTVEENCTTGDIRLIGPTLLEGRVEICINNAWGTICNNLFSSHDPQVICRDLGYNFSDSYSIPLQAMGSGPIFLDNLVCGGHEKRVLDCHVSMGVHLCSHEQDIAVKCVDLNECEENNGGCQDICENLIPTSRDHPGYACHCEQGYSLDEDRHNCSDVDECMGGQGSCHHNATCTNTDGGFVCECDVGFYGSGINCTETCIDGVMAIVPPTVVTTSNNVLMSGRLEMCFNHTIGSLCDDENWGEEEVSVACRQLGFSPYGARVLFGEHAVGDILLSNIQCNGSENILLDCQFDIRGSNEYMICEDHAGVTCQDNSTSYSNCATGEVRVVPGTTNFPVTNNNTMVQGRLEVCINHAWGSVCRDEFYDTVDAEVACRQLGGFTIEGGDFDYHAVAGSGPIFLERLQCTTDHHSLLQCSINTASTCNHIVVGIQCKDLDECVIDPSICDHICNNTLGSFECQCDSGYVLGVDGRTCFDVDECGNLTHNCDSHATCNNTIGSFSCDCNDGFAGEGFNGTCEDVNECNNSEDNECHHEFALCNNTIGTYSCTCRDGFTGDGINCTDINECVMGHDCHDNAGCFNTLGSYNCTCIPGFTGNGTYCTDVDECDEEYDNCDLNAWCNNTEGSFICNCSTGYDGNGTYCEDMDECVLQIDVCHDLYADCINTNGSYDCMCHDGFSGDGRICENIDECELNTHSCHKDAACSDIIGSYNCTCHEGFRGNGTNCDDIDECEEMSHDCHIFAECINIPGAYNCSCFEDFEGNGTFCTCEDGIVRLENGTSSEGRVEVCYEGYYKTVCDDFWDVLEARIVCRQLNFSVNETNAVPVKGGVYGSGVGDIPLDDLLCQGDEENLLECQKFHGNHTCDHSEDAGVRCGDACKENSIRVVLGDGTEFYQTAMHQQAVFYDDILSRGRVEVCQGGEYNAICADSDQMWDNTDAMVICRELGLSPYGAIGLGSGFFNGIGVSVGVTKVQCDGTENSFAECTFESSVDSCEHHAGVICRGADTQWSNCSDGDLRLIGGENAREGRVEVCFSQSWGSICRNQYGSEDATVICRQLNKTLGNLGPGGEPLTQLEFGAGQGPIFLDWLNCDFENERLLDCSALFFLSTCTNQDTIGVRCNDINECEYGLSNCTINADCVNQEDGFTCQCGRGYDGDGFTLCANIDECVEGLDGCAHNCTDTDGSYSCDCMDGYLLGENNRDCIDENECQRLNITCPGEMVCINNEGSYSCGCNPGYTSLDSFNCTNVNECNGWNNCSEFAYCNDTYGSYLCNCMDGFTGDGFSCRDVDECALNETNCHDLAYCVNSNGSYFCECIAGYEGNGMDNCSDVNECKESSLNNCSMFADCSNTEGSYSCTCQHGYEEEANGTICLCVDWKIRLTNGNKQSEGRVEVCFNNEYGTICDDLWDELDATVICRHLGYKGYVHDATHRSYFSSDPMSIVIDNVVCQGEESFLSECTHLRNISGISSCSILEHAGVRCEESCMEHEVRLNNFYGTDTMEDFFQNPYRYSVFFIKEDKEELSKGKVEICVNGTWGTICEGQSWNNSAASVACNQLGFSRYGALDGDVPIAEESNVVMYEVTCGGSEENLTSCEHSFSSSSEDFGCDNAFVICQAIETEMGRCTTGDIRLIDKDGIPQENEGRIEICINNAWGTVCDYLFDGLDADVVCTQLGIAPGAHEVSMEYGIGSGPIFLEGVDCDGDEHSLLACDTLSNLGDQCTHNDDIGVFCQTQCLEDMSVSLSYGNYSWSEGVAGGTLISHHCYYSNFSIEFPGCVNSSSMVHRFCDRRGFWMEPNYSECPTKRRCQLLNIMEREINAEEATAVTMDMKMLLSGAPSEDQTADNVEIVSNVLSQMVSFRDQITSEAFENAAAFVSYIVLWPDDSLEDRSSDIVRSVEGLIEGLLAQSTVPDVNVIEDSLEITFTRVIVDEVPDSGLPFSSSNSDSSILLPKEILGANVVVGFSAYTKASLFPVQNMNEKFSVASPVIGSVITEFDTSSLDHNVTVSLPLTNGVKVPRCMYWDVAHGNWKGDGCTAISTSEMEVKCSCNHLTNFAIIANTDPVECDDTTHTPNEDFTLCIERTPSANVSLYQGLRVDAFVSDTNSPRTYSVKESQQFALLCETEPHFSANWFNSDNEMIPQSIEGNYPSDETAGQLYVHMRAGHISVLMTRGYLEENDHSSRVGVSDVASGEYRCVARNEVVTENITVDIQVESGLLNDKVFIRFTTNRSTPLPLSLLILQYYSTLIIISSEQLTTQQNVFTASCGEYTGPNDRVSSRIECNVTAQSPDELNTFISNYEKVEMYLMRNLGIEDFSITDKGFCDREVNISTIHGNYTWSETVVGENSTSDCQFGPEDGVDIEMAGVTRECHGPHMWEEYYGGYCITEVTAKFRALGNRSLATAEDVADVVDQLNVIFSGGTSDQDQSEGNIQVVLNVFSGAAGLADNVSYTSTIVGDVTGVTSGISDWPEDVLFNSSSGIVSSFEVIAENLVGQENFSNITVGTSRVALSGLRSDTEEFMKGKNFNYNSLATGLSQNDAAIDEVEENSTFSSGSGSGGDSMSTTPITPYYEDIEPESLNISIHIPPAVFSNITDTSVGVLFSFYATSALFPIRKEINSDLPDIVGPVIGASVVGINPPVNLTENIVMTIPVYESLPTNYSVMCVSWNFSAAGERGNWSTLGCNVTQIKRGNATALVTCHCNHLTNFAILVDIDARETKKNNDDINISILSYIGISLSLFGSIISIITLLGAKSLRGRDVTKFHVQLFISLLGLYLTYVIGIERRESEILCTLFSTVILYFTLSSIFWMGAEAVIMFKKLVVVFGFISNKFVIILSLICWLLPIPFVIAAIATLGDKKNYLIQVHQGNSDEEDTSYGYCFVSDLRVLIAVVIVPLTIVMLFNIFMLAVALRVIINQNRKKFFQGGDQHLLRMSLKNMISLIWLVILFGVGWIFGIFTIRGASTVFQYLFVIINGFQGFYFFIFIVLTQREARNFWTDVITRGRFTSRKTTSHNKVYANSSDYKGRKNVGYLTALPPNSNEQKSQLASFLTLPAPTVSAQDSIVCSNESTFEPEMIPLENTQTIRQATNADNNNRIEVTTYLDSTELQIGSKDIYKESPVADAPKPDLTSIEEVGTTIDVEDGEKTPIPPKRRKRNNRATTKPKYHSEPGTHNEVFYQAKCQLDGIEVEMTLENVEAKRRATTVSRQTKVSSHGISRQKPVEDALQTQFEVANPLYSKEE